MTQSHAERDVIRPFFRPRIIIELDGIEDPLEVKELLERNLPQAGELNVEPLHPETLEQIDELVERAQARDPGYAPPNWRAQFTVDTPTNRSSATFARQVRALDFVERAYPDVRATDPSTIIAAGDPRRPDQRYLDKATVGITADAAWQTDGGRGVGQRIVDVEQGWTLEHEDLVAHRIDLLDRSVVAQSRPHGTAVLGVICAPHNGVGVAGIAPDIKSAAVVSHDGSASNVPGAITKGAHTLACGEVLLLEVQTGGSDAEPPGTPIELLNIVFQQIELVTKAGVIVVAAVGNGGHLLDNLKDDTGDTVLAPGARDSGAILVGAATSAVPHTRLDSCHGARVDCYAWGQDVFSTSSTDWGAINYYIRSFSGTSAAAATVAGCVLATQGAYWARHEQRMGPEQVRELLRDPALGTKTAGNQSIGVMPDLERLIPEALERALGGCAE